MDQIYEDRFQEEIKQIQLKDFDSYFLVVADLVAFAKKQVLVGPARGSSAGSLACYLLGITEADPLPHRLLFQRFIDISRSDLPDIDIDFADTHRYLVFEYLQQEIRHLERGEARQHQRTEGRVGYRSRREALRHSIP